MIVNYYVRERPYGRSLMFRAYSVLLFVLLIGCGAGAQTEPSPADPSTNSPQGKHIIVISVDGLRPDAIEKAKAPVMQSMIKSGTWCPVAQTIRPSVTLPSHTSMVTGLTYREHGVTWNVYRKGLIKKATMFSVAKDAGLSCAAYFAKSKLRFLTPPAHVDRIIGPPAPRKKGKEWPALDIAKQFLKDWETTQYNLTFIHFKEPDSAGHGRGWMSKTYLKAVSKVDKAIGIIVQGLKDAGSYEQTVIIITADHGGVRRGHGGNHPKSQTIPWLCAGAGIPVGLRIEREIRTYDTAPTALKLLGLDPPKDIAGKAVEEVLSQQ